ncbi:uncharacterized protein LOC107226955 isoform X2 [Neodiprion lecontei]|uniref:Uncharacterized protein LOC107226955 isoform X2 n=1 Tax=Neodiprion lecontei TaxID=441921 RepID=A0A6J0CAJ3_NEOLC|nr:uncharacterized protein LOC107226955 isoform X2 [Neodiprion lecontei]
MARAGEGVDFSGCCQVIFNLATSGGGRTDEICKIAACTEMGQFRSYIMPLNGIPPMITNVNGLRVMDGELYENDKKVDTDPAETAITKFLDFLDTQRQSRPVILVAHKAHEFHGPRILRLVTDLGMMEEFQSRVAGFACTLLLFQTEFPERDSHALKNIAEGIPGFNWEAKAAYYATRMEELLMEVIRYYGIENNITNYTESAEAASTKLKTDDRKASLEEIRTLNKKQLSPPTRGKMAEAGIGYQDLVEAYRSGSDDGVLQLLQDVGLRRDVKNKILEHLRVSVPRTPQPIE